MIPDDAREAAVPWINDFIKRRGLVLRGKEAQVLAGYVLEAAVPHLASMLIEELRINGQYEAADLVGQVMDAP